MKLQMINGMFAVCKIKSLSEVHADADFYFLSRTDEELSLVCRSEHVPENPIAIEDGWQMFRVVGTLDFSLTGILARISDVLAAAKICIFAVSTYNTDYILVKSENLPRAIDALQTAGYEI